MRTPLIAALGLAAALAAAPLTRGEDGAYSALVGMATAPDDGHVEEGRLPEGLDGPAARHARAYAVPQRTVAPQGTPRPVTSAARPSVEPAGRDSLRDAVRDEAAVVAAASRHAPSAWTRLYAILLPSSRSGIPELKASTSAFAGARPVRRDPAPYVPHETEEGVRRGMADMLAIMSAGAEPPAPSR